MIVMEKVIVVITTYNLEKYIKEALDSVLRQKTNFKFKILIGDDASTDSTPEILKEYQNKYSDIIELKLSDKNLGSLKNSNRLFDRIQCDYFTFLDGDDYWEDEYRLQKQVDFMETHKEYMLCAGNTQYIRNNEKAELLLKPEELGKTYSFYDFINHKMPFFHVSSILIRNTIYINGLPKCYKDCENTFENCALRGEDFRRISHLEKGPLYAMPELFSYYRIHENGMWQGASVLKHKIEGAISYNFYRKFYKNTTFYEAFCKDFSFYYSDMMKYLVLNKDLINTYSLNKQESNLFTDLLNDLANEKYEFIKTTNIIVSEKERWSFKVFAKKIIKRIIHKL